MEGPGVRMIVEQLGPLAGRMVTSAGGSSRIDYGKITGQRLRQVHCIGKLLFLRFPRVSIRIHFLMWGRYRLDDPVEGKSPRLTLQFENGSRLDFYTTAVTLLSNAEVARLHDPALDPMDEHWDEEYSLARARKKADDLICDTLLDQEVLAGPGNLIKNEALFAERIHPASLTRCIPDPQLRGLFREVRDFSFRWLEGKRQGIRRPVTAIYQKGTCPSCGGKVRSGRMGRLKRISFWCPACQALYPCGEREGSLNDRVRTPVEDVGAFQQVPGRN
jgi:endonuclease VIII